MPAQHATINLFTSAPLLFIRAYSDQGIYSQTDAELVLPHMRSAVEEQLNLIAHGQADYQAVLQHALDIFKLKFHFFVQQIQRMDELFEVTFSSLAETGKPLSRLVQFFRVKPAKTEHQWD